MHSIGLCIFLNLTVFIGRVRSDFRIMGGKDADESKYPYIVKLDHEITFLQEPNTPLKYFQVCTCSVLTSIWTLSAAHCFGLKYGKVIDNIKAAPVIRYGSISSSWATTPIKLVVIHPAFRNRIMNSATNDIGLAKTEPISLNEYARVSAIDFSTLVGQEVNLVGYGITNSSKGIAGDATEVGKPLQILDAVVIACDKGNVDITPAVCVARRCGQSSGICHGDSGGPMIHSSGVVGVNSLGADKFFEFCFLESNAPNYGVAVITPTSPFVDWISETITKDSQLSFL